MTELILTQKEADTLISAKKSAINQDYINLPDLGGSIDILLYANQKKEEFVLSYTRHSINLSKRNHHLRGRKVIGLVRLDLDGPPHRNPDGKEIGSRHLHLYREGYGLKWAFEVPTEYFSNLENTFLTLEEFLKYCNVEEMPNIVRGLFS